jgi:hypothetical protein
MEAKMKTLEEVIEEVKRERETQMKKWPAGPNQNYAHRPVEEWLLLAEQYLLETRTEYTHKPGFAAAREKLIKVANLVLWGLQSDSKTD